MSKTSAMNNVQIPLDEIEPDELLKPMSRELFLKMTLFRGDIDMFVRALDRAGYWDKRPRSFEQKREYVRRKCQRLRDEEGNRIFYYFRRKVNTTVESLAIN
jgi:hypothetical protein